MDIIQMMNENGVEKDVQNECEEFIMGIIQMINESDV